MAHAVITSGGKQFVVTDGSKVRVDRLTTEEGKSVTLTDVLLTADGDNIAVGAPFIKGATVEATVVRHGRHKKITGVKMKAKKRHKKIFGHKQHFTELEITKISVE